VVTSSPAQGFDGPTSSGLRDRKKQKTRSAIQDAALELFSDQGFEATTVEQIAALAEVSTATFFRYFRTKGEVIFGGQDDRVEDLERAIVDRPASEGDLEAIRHALRVDWIPSLDPQRVMRQTRAAKTSPLLRGLSSDLGAGWQRVIATALATRHGLAAPDRRCNIIAAIAFAIMSNAVNLWTDSGGQGALPEVTDSGFALLGDGGGDPIRRSGASVRSGRAGA
jgi:AcrR family transcriptional regulator